MYQRFGADDNFFKLAFVNIAANSEFLINKLKKRGKAIKKNSLKKFRETQSDLIELLKNTSLDSLINKDIVLFLTFERQDAAEIFKKTMKHSILD